jgi:hypothetical protein
VIRRRFEHTIVLAIAIEVSMVITFEVLLLAPRWQLQVLVPAAGENSFALPESWSPDGSALLTKANGGSLIFRDTGDLFLRLTAGSELVWVDDVTLLRLERVQETTYRMSRLDTRDGRAELIGEPIHWGHLISDGHGNVAHQREGEATTAITVIDSTDGRRLAELEGYAALTWTDDGALIVKRPEPALRPYFLAPGTLFYWRPGAAPRPLGSGLVVAGNVAPLSPAGDAIACICVTTPFPTEPPPDGPDRAIYRIPIDGSSPTRLTPWPTHGGGSPEIAWIDETSLAAVAGDGLSRVPATGGLLPIPGLTAADLGFETMLGRVFRLRGYIVAGLQDLVGRRDTILVVIDQQDRIRLRRWSVGSLPVITVDPAHVRGAVGTEYRLPGDPSSWEVSMLEFR